MIQSAINSMFSNISGTAYQMKRDADIEALHKEKVAKAAEKLKENNDSRKAINEKLQLLSSQQAELEQRLKNFMAKKRSNKKKTVEGPTMHGISPLKAMMLEVGMK